MGSINKPVVPAPMHQRVSDFQKVFFSELAKVKDFIHSIGDQPSNTFDLDLRNIIELKSALLGYLNKLEGSFKAAFFTYHEQPVGGSTFLYYLLVSEVRQCTTDEINGFITLPQGFRDAIAYSETETADDIRKLAMTMLESPRSIAKIIDIIVYGQIIVRRSDYKKFLATIRAV